MCGRVPGFAWVGDFPDPACRALAEKIQSGDIAGLERLLAGGPPPSARDRAGNKGADQSAFNQAFRKWTGEIGRAHV